MSDRVEPRALGAIRFVDATTRLDATGALRVGAPGVHLVRNLRGWFVLLRAPGVDVASGTLHRPPDGPRAGSAPLEMTVDDPSGQYLARRFTVPFPRDPDPARAAADDSLFRPVEVDLFRSPAARTAPNWAVVRAAVRQRTGDAPAPGALIRVVRTRGRALLARGLSDARGEALVAVPGIPVTTWEERSDRVLATEVEVTLQVVWDPRAGPLPDPDDLERRHARLRVRTARVRLASGRLLVQAL